MHFDMMLPHQIRSAIAANWPVVLPLGVLEYHGEHLASHDELGLPDASPLPARHGRVKPGHPASTSDRGRTGALDGRLRGGHDEVGSGHRSMRRVER